MTEYTIITIHAVVEVFAHHYAQGPDGDMYLYAKDDDEPKATVRSGEFVAIFESDHGAVRAHDPETASTQ